MTDEKIATRVRAHLNWLRGHRLRWKHRQDEKAEFDAEFAEWEATSPEAIACRAAVARRAAADLVEGDR